MTPEQIERMTAQRAALAEQLESHLTRMPDDDGTKKAARLLKHWEADRKALETVIAQADQFMAAPPQEGPIDVPVEEANRWAEKGVAIASIPKGRKAELRVSLNEWQGRQTVDLRLWYSLEPGGVRGPSKKGVSIQASKLDALIEGLVQAREQLRMA